MEIDVKKILAHNIKNFRALKELSQADFAEKISLQMQAISQMENAKTYPAPENLSKICNNFNVSPAVLFSCADFLSKKKYELRQEVVESINLSLTELDEDELEFVLGFIGLVAKRKLK